MSIDRCQRCGALVDTDTDDQAYVQIGDMRKREEFICLCPRHREEYEWENQEPDLETLHLDAVRAMERYWEARRRHHG